MVKCYMISGKIRLINEWDMLENNKQEIANVNNSLVQQANGDINNYGLGYNDVKEICRDVLRQELAIVTKEATNTLNQEISAFENQFVDRLEKLENPQVMDKLRNPKLQFVLHDTMKEYAKTDDIDTKEELVDLMIERLKVEEHTTEQYLIDQSIKIIPSLSLYQAYFLGALTLRKVINQGYSFIVDSNLGKRALLYEYLDEISNLDIHYLKLTNCCSDMSGTKYYVSMHDLMKPEYDLLFRHYITEEEYDNFIRSHNNVPSVKGQQIIYKKGGTNEVYLLYSSKQYFIQELNKENKMDFLPLFEELINLFTPFTNDEISQHLISLNSNWQKAFDCLNKEEVTHIDLTPVGTYIGRRIVKKVTKDDTLPLVEFYK